MLSDLNTDLLENDIEIERYKSKTYALDFDKKIVSGFTDGINSIKQAIVLMLSTQRFESEIYSWNYGCELDELIGVDVPLVYAKIKEYISEALMEDDRIVSVDNFEFDQIKNTVTVKFDVETTLGNILVERQVSI